MVFEGRGGELWDRTGRPFRERFEETLRLESRGNGTGKRRRGIPVGRSPVVIPLPGRRVEVTTDHVDRPTRHLEIPLQVDQCDAIDPLFHALTCYTVARVR